MKTLLCLAALPLLAAAQNFGPEEVRFHGATYFPKPPTTIRTDTNLVDIGVVVRDNRGHAVGGLTKADFDVRDEGKHRDVAAFAVTTFTRASAPAEAASGGPASAPGGGTPGAPVQPRWVVMVFDDLATAFADLVNAKAAAKRFVKDGLAANDRVAIFTTTSGGVLPFTSDAGKLAAAIDTISFRERKAQSLSCPLLTEYDAYRIATGTDNDALAVKSKEYDDCAHVCPSGGGGRRGGSASAAACPTAIAHVQSMSRSLWEETRMNTINEYQTLGGIVNYLAGMQGTRMMLLASSGFVSGSLEYEQDRLTEQALRANVVINALDAKGLYTTNIDASMAVNPRSLTYQQRSTSEGKMELNDVLGSLADATGGLFFHDNNDLNRGFHEVGMQPEVSYLLAIAPEKLDGKFHKLKVGLTDGRHLTVQTRKGYTAVARKADESAGPRRLDTEVMATGTVSDAPVAVVARSKKSPEGQEQGCLTFQLDMTKAQFHQQAGAWAQQYRMIGAFFHEDGSYVTGIEGTLDFALKEANYQELVKIGAFNADLCVAVPFGAYRMRTVAVEGDDHGRYAAATQAVELR
jgi:VWFA-related protein